MELNADAMRIERVYVLPDGTAAVTPDGIGIYWYDDEDDALEDFDGPAIYLDDDGLDETGDPICYPERWES